MIKPFTSKMKLIVDKLNPHQFKRLMNTAVLRVMAGAYGTHGTFAMIDKGYKLHQSLMILISGFMTDPTRLLFSQIW